MLDETVTLPPSPGSVATCDGASAQNRAMVPILGRVLQPHELRGRPVIALAEFTVGHMPEPENAWQRAERRRVVAYVFRRERIRAAADRLIGVHRAMPRARTSHRVGAPKPTTSSSDDDGEGPPRRYERVLVATVRPDGSPCEAVVEIDPLHIDPTALVFAARRAAGHSLASAAAGLDDVRWRAIHPHGKAGAA